MDISELEKIHKQTLVNVFITDTMIASSMDKNIIIWDLSTQETINELVGHTREVTCLIVDKKDRLISGADDNRIRIWDIESGKTIRILEGHTSYITCLIVDNKDRLISGSEDGKIRIWDLETGETIRLLTLKDDLNNSWPISFVVDDFDRLIVSMPYLPIQVWDMNNFTMIHGLGTFSNPDECLAIDKLGRLISSHGDKILIWNIETRELVQTLESHTNLITCLAVDDLGRLISGSLDKTIRVWNLDTGEVVHIFGRYSHPIRKLTFSPDKTILLANTGGEIICFEFPRDIEKLFEGIKNAAS